MSVPKTLGSAQTNRFRLGRAVGILLALQPRPALCAPPFDDGLAARKAWETMIAGLHADERRGAEYWAGQRSRPVPGACEDGSPDIDFIGGCRSAQAILGPSDLRRRTEPEFRRGWNSYQPTSQARPDCAAIPSGAERLACYDSAANRGTPAPASRQDGLFHARRDDTVGCVDSRMLSTIRKFPELEHPSAVLTTRLAQMSCYPVAADLGWSLLETNGAAVWMRLTSPAVPADTAIVSMFFDRDSMIDGSRHTPR